MPDRETLRRMTRRRFLRLAAAAGFLAGSEGRWLAAETERARVTGTVTGDGRPLAGVCVSDGLRVTKTDAKGRYLLDVGPASGRFLFVTTPRGYWTDAFHVPTGKAARRGSADFHLRSRPQRDRFRFVFWTDMHLEGGGTRLDKFRNTVAETNALEPAFVWAQGDIALQGHAGKDYVSCCSDLKAPIRNGAGNHEMMLDASNPRIAFESLFGPTYYSFDWAGIHCVVLDGNRVVSREKHWSSVHGDVSKRELAWLEADLAAKPAGMPVVAAIHIPLVSTYSERRGGAANGMPPWIVRNRAQVRAVLEAHDARLVLQGHLHENERVLLGGTEYVASQAVAGSWWRSGDGFERGVDNAPRGYRIVEVDGTRISHRFHSSCESHLEAPGDFARPGGAIAPSRKTYFVYNCFDAPHGARSQGRVDEGPWQSMAPYPAVNHRLRLIMPHHFLLEVDTTKLAPGEHSVEVKTASRSEVVRHRAEFAVQENAPAVPVIYSTDLYHPHQDPDDHFDLATIFALQEIDLRAVILDDGVEQRKRPGIGAVRQLMKITGRRAPVAAGLAPKLRSARDSGKDQPPDFQKGVNLILDVLRQSDSPVTVVTVGSLRDVAAAYNREPELCAAKIGRLYAFIGDSHSAEDFEFREWNVTLDVNAYTAVMRSGLPVYWVPCFDGGLWKNNGRASFWRASHEELLAKVRDPLKQYFIYALLKKERPDPVSFLERPVDAGEWAKVLAGRRNLWCCAVFTHVVDRRIVVEDGSWHSRPRTSPGGGRPAEPFTFERVLVDVDATGKVRYPKELPYYSVERFRVTDPRSYPESMTALSAQLLSRLG